MPLRYWLGSQVLQGSGNRPWEERGAQGCWAVLTQHFVGSCLPGSGLWGLETVTQILIPQLGSREQQEASVSCTFIAAEFRCKVNLCCKNVTEGKSCGVWVQASPILSGRFPCCKCKVWADVVLTRSYDCVENALSFFLSRS